MKQKLTKNCVEKLLEQRFANDTITSLSKLPHPYSLLNTQKAAKRINHAVKNSQKIAIVGDYDVDGVTSSALLWEFFDRINYPVQIIIPNRFSDGYGLGCAMIDRLDCNLLLTVDNGISAHAAASLCKQRGIDLIIVDHHTIPEQLPEAFAIIHPKQQGCTFPFKDVCAATLAWYLVGALKLEFGLDFQMRDMLDLAAIATVADVMPLIDINRTIVKSGIEVMNKTKRPCIEALRNKLCKTSFDSGDIAFAISPRLNCAGRLRSAELAFRFLCSKDLKEAQTLLEELSALNEERKEIEKEVFEQACLQVGADDKIAVVWGDDWHEGVVGIAASRIASRYKIPAIVLSVHKDKAKGSARSVGSINLYELIDTQRELLGSFGGHKMAAGLSLSGADLPTFAQNLKAICALKQPQEFTCENSAVLGELDMGEIDMELCEILQKFEPYGERNTRPLFTGTQKLVKKRDYIGKDSKTLRLLIRQGDGHLDVDIKAICFRSDTVVSEGEAIDFCYSVVKNSFNNRQSVELVIEEFTGN